MSLQLRTKTILICVAVFFLSIGSSTIVNAVYFTREYLEARKSETFMVARTLKSQLDRLLTMHIPLRQLEGFDEVCHETVNKYNYLAYAMVVGEKGEIIFHYSPGDQMVSNPAIVGHLQEKRESVHLYALDGEQFYDFQVPVHNGAGEHIATVRIGFPQFLISQKTRSLIFYSISTALVAFIIGISLLYLSFGIWVNKPVEKFLDTIKNIQNDLLSSRQLVGIRADDELGQLARAFDEMTVALRETTVSRDFMDDILENMQNSLIILDELYIIQSVNQESLNLLGYTEKELIGASISKILGEPVQANMDGAEEAPPVRQVKAVETVYISRTGAEIPVLFSCSFTTATVRQSQGYICVAQDISELRALRGFLPICSVCKKIRDDKGYWNQIESYIATYSSAKFSHSMCPDCMKVCYPEEYELLEAENKVERG